MSKQARQYATAGFVAVIVGVSVLLWPRLKTDYDIRLAKLDLEKSNPDSAIGWLRKAESLSPSRGDVQYWLGVANRRAGHLSAALEHFDRAGKSGWPPSQLHGQRVLAQFQAGNRREVEPELQKMLRSGPSDDFAAEIYEALVKGYLADLRFKEAILCLNYWVEWQPDSIPARLLRADAFSIVGESETQEKDLRYILRLEPSRLEVRVRLGQLLMAHNRVDESLNQFTECHRQYPGDQQSLLGMANCEYRLGRFADAERHADDALTTAVTDSQRAFAMILLGQIAIGKKQYQRAVSMLEKATQIEPNEPSGYYNLGIAQNKLGDSERSKQSMSKYERLDRLTTRLGDLGDAVLHSPDNPQLRFEAATILRELGDRQAAIRWLLSAATADPTFVEANEALADLYRAVGQNELAQQRQNMADEYRRRVSGEGPN